MDSPSHTENQYGEGSFGRCIKRAGVRSVRRPRNNQDGGVDDMVSDLLRRRRTEGERGQYPSFFGGEGGGLMGFNGDDEFVQFTDTDREPAEVSSSVVNRTSEGRSPSTFSIVTSLVQTRMK